MTLKTKIYLAAAALLVAAFLLSTAWSTFRSFKLEKEIDTAKQNAENSEKAAADAEQKAGEYKAKIEYLENDLAEIQQIARRQDDELEKITADTSAARDRVRDARNVRAVATTISELCKKLADIGHPCE
jgi:predicted RNase H-like nuclease (RuvC/YqgF family)